MSDKCQIKKRVLVGVHVECEPPQSILRWSRSIEQQARDLESWACEIRDFFRDHRSMDPVEISIVRDYNDVCSVCEREWEPYEDDGITYCANCGIELDSINIVKEEA